MREAVILEHGLEPGRVRALGKPDALGREAEEPSRRAQTDAELRLDGGAVEERQVTMGRGRGEDLHMAGPCEVGERADEIAPEARAIRLAQPAKRVDVEARERRAGMIVGVDEPAYVPLGAAHLVVDVLEIAHVDVVVGELLEQDRREADDDAERDTRVAQIVEQHEERQVRTEHRLVDPFLAVRPATRAAAVRQMRVEGEHEGSHEAILAVLRSTS